MITECSRNRKARFGFPPRTACDCTGADYMCRIDPGALTLTQPGGSLVMRWWSIDDTTPITNE